MAARSKARLWERIDVLGEEIAALSSPEDEAVQQTKVIELFELVYQVCSEPEMRDAIGEFFIKNFRDYDPGKGKFSNYLKRCLKFRESDLNVQDATFQIFREVDPNTGKEVRWRKYASSLNAPVGGENSEDAGQFNLLEDKEAWRPFDAVESDYGNALLLQLAALMINLPERLHGKANNPIRMLYFRLFYTAGVTSFLKQDPAEVDVYSAHEREIFEAMKSSFLDYYMEESCRTVVQLAYGNLKRYGELVSGRPMDQETELPIPGDVYLAYLERIKGHQAKAAALSQQRTAFKEFLRADWLNL